MQIVTSQTKYYIDACQIEKNPRYFLHSHLEYSPALTVHVSHTSVQGVSANNTQHGRWMNSVVDDQITRPIIHFFIPFRAEPRLLYV